MKTKTATFILLTALVLMGWYSHAEQESSLDQSSSLSKSGTPINFNAMIDENNVNKEDLTKKSKAAAAKGSEKKTDKKLEKKEAQKSMDLLDLDVGWGKNPPAVDRRYNSVEAPRPASTWLSYIGIRK